ncbi:MAG: UPF0182 family protein, partial [Gemmatimonadales bacterium]
MKRRPLIILVAAAALAVALFGLPSFAGLVTDWYWFSALGYQTVFLKTIGTKITLVAVVGAVAFTFFYANLRLAQRGISPALVMTGSQGGQALDLTRLLRVLSLPVAGFLGLLVGLAAAGDWLTLLRFVNRTPFGEVDPVFDKDIAYYFFTLPALQTLLGLVVALTVVALFITIPLYVLRREIVVQRRRVSVEPAAGAHLAWLVAALFVTTAANLFLVRVPSLLYSTSGPLYGASYSDLAVRVRLFQLLGLVWLAGAVLVVLGARRRKLVRNTVAAGVLYIGVALAGTLLAATIQKFVVLPNELERETPQLEYHIAATRRAWGLDDVEIRDLTGEATLSLRDIQANNGTVRNIRLWDREPLLQTFRQLQEIRTYYDFQSVDDDRYWIDGEYRQVLLSPRELNSRSLPTRNFINERLTYTHGMGLTLGPVNQVSPEGLPVLFVKDLPPASSVSLEIQRPAIYYGELSSSYVFVNTRQPEFDYPLGDTSAFAVYEGTGGVPVSSFLRRLLFSIRFRSMDVLFTELITRESRVLFHRRIMERASKALPFLVWDRDPYLVVTAEGRLKWILDAYTTSDRYPYSQPVGGGTNYMRNSVKVVIDAYDGDIQAYIAEPSDPLVVTYAKIFPGIFQPLDSMPEDLRAHIRFPSDLFRVQTALYTTYHMDEPDVFYSREDQWQIPSASETPGGQDPFLRHMVMKLPGEEREEYITMTPFTPRQKDNLAAWMVARSDGEHYGRLVVYRFPRQSLVFGPTQVVNRINQDTEISRQISLWDQRGSQVIRGNLLVIPVEESLMFVQALYLRAEGGRIPELKRVIVAYQNRVIMEETLSEGLSRLFGGAVEVDRPRAAAAAAAEYKPSQHLLPS